MTTTSDSEPFGRTSMTARLTRYRPRHSRVAQMMSIPSVRQKMIAEAAYFRAAQRNFAPGHELEDWLAAEQEIDTRLTRDVPFA